MNKDLIVKGQTYRKDWKVWFGAEITPERMIEGRTTSTSWRTWYTIPNEGRYTHSHGFAGSVTDAKNKVISATECWNWKWSDAVEGVN